MTGIEDQSDGGNTVNETIRLINQNLTKNKNHDMNKCITNLTNFRLFRFDKIESQVIIYFIINKN